MKIDLSPHELDFIISALAFYDEEFSEMNDHETADVRELAERLNDIADNFSSSQETGGSDSSRINDSPRYRADMIDAGRGRLVR